MIDRRMVSSLIQAETAIQDLRRPDIDETPLSDEEVRHGVTRAFIAPGPHAHSRAFAEVTVTQRMTVEVWQIEGVE